MGSGKAHAKRYMLSWLSDVCAEAREDADATLADIASAGRFSVDKVRTFEDDADRWPRGREGIDQLLAAYAAVIGLQDHRELWLRAIQRWLQCYERPLAIDRGKLIESLDGADVPAETLDAIEQVVELFARQREEANSATASPATPSSRAVGKRTRR